MNSTETTIQKNEWQAAFKRLGHDIDAFRALTEVWPGKESAAGDLLAILNHRRVIRQGLEVFLHWDCLDAYKQEMIQLETIWKESERQLAESVDRDQAKITAIINQHWIPTLETLETQIRQVRRDVRDNYVYENRSEPESRQTAVTCLDIFQKMALCADELSRAPFEGLGDARRFITQFEVIESLLERNFGYFDPARDDLADMRQRMYGLETWWLTRIPDSDEVEDEIPDEWVDDLFQAYRSDQTDETADCDQAPLAIAYAMNELDADAKEKTYHHLLTCGACFELASDVQAAEHQARKTEDKPPEISPEIADAIQSAATVNKPEPSRFLQTIRYALDGLSNLFAPKFVSVMTTACIFIVVVLYGSSLMFSPKKSEKGVNLKTMRATIDVTAISGPLSIRGENDVASKFKLKPGATLQTGDHLSIRGENDVARKFKLEPGATLQTGDHFSIAIKVNRDAYCYLLMADQGAGRITKLFEGEVRANQPEVVPRGAKGFRLGVYRGAKTLFLLASDKKIEAFEHKMKELQQKGAESIQTLFPNAAVQRFGFEHQ